MHEAVRAELNAARAGTRAAKSRGLVAGGRAKPWRQKGTGRARAGTIRAPQFTGGGVAFPPQPRDFYVKVNRKARRAALRAALSAHAAGGTLACLDGAASTSRRRKQRARAPRRLGQGVPARRRRDARTRSALIKSFRNLERVLVTVPAELEVAHVVWARSLLVTEAALRARRSGGPSSMSLHPNEVLLAPVVSEKSYSLIEDRKYSFKVHPDAHKTQIRQAVEQLFDVQVESVNISGCKPKPKRRGMIRAAGRAGRRRSCSCARARRSRSSRGPRFTAIAAPPQSATCGPSRTRLIRCHQETQLMPVRRFKPTSPGRRFMTVSDFDEVTKKEPEKSLLEPVTKKGGRNNKGRMTTRHQGGGHKRRYRKIDFKRTKDGVPAKVAAIEYDPNRSARIALLHYADGAKSYILAPARPEGRRDARVRPERRHPARERAAAREHPDGHARPQRRAQARQGRPAGAERRRRHPARREGRGLRRPAHAVGRDAPGACSRAAPRSVRSVTSTTSNITGGKAGRSRWKGKRPSVRGSAMNPVDHPHGGGEGKSKGGRHPVTPWGVPTLGKRTRRKHKESDKLIVRGRRRGKEKR